MKKNLINILILAVIWIIAIIIINPNGEFTYGDDFAYAGPVKTMLDTGELHITDWSSMTLVGHIWFGWLATSLFGFSFTVLRFTSLIFGFLGVIGVYFLSKEFFNDKSKQFAITMLFGFSPQFFIFCFAFMTDISFFVFFVWSILFFVKYLKTGKTWNYVIALLLGLYAFLIRDLALVLPVAFFFATLSKYGYKSRKFYYIVFPLLLFVIEYFAYRYWFVNIHGMTHNMDFSKDRIMQMLTDPIFLIKNLGRNFLYSSFYLGFYLSPIVIPVFLSYLKFKIPKTKFMLLTLILMFSLVMLSLIFISERANSIMQYVLNLHHSTVWYVLPDIHNPTLELTETFPRWLLAIQSTISVFAGISLWGLLGSRLYDYSKEGKCFEASRQRGPAEMLIWSFLVYFALIMTQIFFPRYQIQTTAILAIIVLINSKIKFSPKENKLLMLFSGVMFAFIFFSTVSGTHDMMAFSRTRARALRYLNDTLHIAPEKIDGGFEYNSWHFYKWDYEKNNKNRWWVQDDEYVVIYGKIKGYRLLKEYKFLRFNPPEKISKIYVYKRNNK